MSLGSPGGVLRNAGVVAIEDSLDERALCPNPGDLRRFSWANSAASLRDMAELFFCVVLNWNLGFGMNLIRASCTFSSRALIA